MGGRAPKYAPVVPYVAQHIGELCRDPRHVRLRARRMFRRSDDMPCSMHMWKTLRVPRDTRQMCRTQAYKHLFMPTGRVPGVRGRARTRPGWVRSPTQYEHYTHKQHLAVNLYEDVIKFAHLQHQVSFHDLVAPVVRLTTDARCRRGRSHEQSGHQQETAGDH